MPHGRPSLTNFDLNLLVALDALLVERNVTRAAERLHLSQSAMSGILQRLRAHFGDELLMRVGREMELTPLARALVKPARDALMAARAVLETEPTFDPRVAVKEMKIMMSDYCIVVVLPKLLARLSQEAPNIRCRIVPINGNPFADLDGAVIDICITTDQWHLFGYEELPNQIIQSHLFRDSFCCLVSQDFPEVESMTKEMLATMRHIKVFLGEDTPSLVEDAFRRVDLALNVVASVPSFSLLPFVVGGPDMVGIVQRRLAKHFEGVRPLRALAPPVEIPTLQETMLWHIRSEQEPAHVWMRSILMQIGEELDAELV